MGVLFPTIAYKNMTVHVNFGAQQLKALPFKCRMFQDATAKDVTVEAASKDGKAEVVIPVGLPDQGTYRYLSMFHEKNPGYTELSVCALLNWAKVSGVPGCEAGEAVKRRCGDQLSDNCTGVASIDDGSLSNAIKRLAPLQKRNYVLLDVKNNLLEEQRKATLGKFPSDSFKKVAQVTLGEPDKEFCCKDTRGASEGETAKCRSNFPPRATREEASKDCRKKKEGCGKGGQETCKGGGKEKEGSREG